MAPSSSSPTAAGGGRAGIRGRRAAGEEAAAATSTTGGCPIQCRVFQELPGDRGVMITLGAPPPVLGDDGAAAPDVLGASAWPVDADSPAGAALGGDGKGFSSPQCTCLQLHPQEDANLPQFHPNIYIPSSLLEYPEQLVKYGGGGSGVTVFGGYHPLLGSLVMKHGGHKDLIELVSLAKIEREMGVRGQWKIDCLVKGSRREDNGDMSETDHAVGAPAANRRGKRNTFVATSNAASIMEDVTPAADRQGKRKTFVAPSNAAAIVEDVTMVADMTSSAVAGVPKKMVKGRKSQPMLNTMGSVMRRMGSALTFASAENLSSSLRRRRSTIKGSNGEGNGIDREAEMRAIRSAMEDMRRTIPAFRMIYISPMHLRERKEELKNSTYRSSTRSMRLSASGNESLVELEKVEEDKVSQSSDKAPNLAEINGSANSTKSREMIRRHSSLMRTGREIHLSGSPNTKASSIHVHPRNVDLCFGGSYCCVGCTDEEANVEKRAPAQGHSCRSRADGSDGYACMMAFVEQLRHKQEGNEWKVTLAQQTIGQVAGGESAETASSLLARGELRGPLLHHLIDSEIRMINNLQVLTMPEEVDVVESVRVEYESMMSLQNGGKQKVSAEEVSKMTNDFVGKAIHKNFHPVTGRFVMLRRFGVDLRHGKIHLKPKEVIPAKHLEDLFYHCWEIRGLDADGLGDGSENVVCRSRAESFDQTFSMNYPDPGGSSHPYRDHPIFAGGLDQWLSLLKLSLSMKHPNATNRIWTCGLTDGGLHNMFLSKDRHWMFDLGEPNLEPIPAFLTKFLMSFFHSMGMEEDEKGDWVVRFEQDDSGKLRLTQRTMELMPKVMEAFNTTLDRLIEELFGGEEEVRVLLLRYVVTQLISDAAFCIEKWRIKGGGDASRSDHQYFLEKWLWRALWDIYASEEIRRRYLTRMIFRRQTECRNLSAVGDLDTLTETE